MSEIIHTLELSEPLDIGDKTITKLEFKKLKAGHVARTGYPFDSKGEVKADVILDLAEKSTTIARTFLEELTPHDHLQITGVIANFFTNNKQTKSKVATA